MSAIIICSGLCVLPMLFLCVILHTTLCILPFGMLCLSVISYYDVRGHYGWLAQKTVIRLPLLGAGVVDTICTGFARQLPHM